MNIKLTIAYDGSAFYGSAIQPDKYTVQGKLEDSLKILGIKSKTNFSGRTDKGVHATNQIVSVDIPLFWQDLDRLKIELNKLLPNSIFVKQIKKVDDNFHARFSVKQRTYRYIVSTKPLTPFNYNYFHYEKDIDQNSIDKAIELFVGKHDFKYFSKQGSEPNSTIREIYKIKLYQYKEFYIFTFTANAYLRSQIRMIVDSLLKISKKTLTLEQLQEQIDTKIQHTTSLAPASGLYLTAIRG